VKVFPAGRRFEWNRYGPREQAAGLTVLFDSLAHGKTRLCVALAGLMRPDGGGKISFDGRLV